MTKTPRAAAQWGLCLQAVSRWSEADPLLAEALSAVKDPWVKKNREILKESLETVKSHVGRIEVIGQPAGATVVVGGREVGKLPLPGALTVNEGSVDIEVSAEGYATAVRTLMVAGASYQNVVLRLQKTQDTQLPSIPEVAAQEPTTGLTATPSEPETSRSILRNPWVWVGLGVLATVGITIAALSLSSGGAPPAAGQIRDVP